MAAIDKSASGIEFHILSDFYGGTFEDTMNDLFSRANIRATAARIIELEATLGPYQEGKFNRYLVPNDFAWPVPRGEKVGGPEQFEADFGKIPDVLRQRVSDVIRANVHSANPLPVFFRTTTNVDQSHDIVIKPFVFDGTTFIGVLFLCPNFKTPT
jgi:hypothetical protein